MKLFQKYFNIFVISSFAFGFINIYIQLWVFYYAKLLTYKTNINVILFQVEFLIV